MERRQDRPQRRHLLGDINDYVTLVVVKRVTLAAAHPTLV
jgi:hypothetical protein